MNENLYFAVNALQQSGIDPNYQAVCREVCVEALVENFGSQEGLTQEENYQSGLKQLRLTAEAGIRREDLKGYEASLGDLHPDSLIVLRPTVVKSAIAPVQEIYNSLVRGFKLPDENVNADR